ncbi:MAG: lytic transglycosylase domain-containing protein [Burkholderiales bacterium]
MNKIAVLAAVLGLWLSVPAAMAAVYVSFDEQGVPRFASQPLDESYVLVVEDGAQAGVAPAQALALQPAGRSPARKEPREAVGRMVERAAARHALDPLLLRAVARVESGFDTRAVSPRGAAGVMQLMPATARQYGVADRFDAERNIDAGARHLKALLLRHGGNVALALAAYNAGEGAVARHGLRVPPFRETMLYVPQVLAAQHSQAAVDAQ